MILLNYLLLRVIGHESTLADNMPYEMGHLVGVRS